MQIRIDHRAHHRVRRRQAAGRADLGAVLLDEFDIFVTEGGDGVVVVGVDLAVAALQFERQGSRQTEGGEQCTELFENAAPAQRLVERAVLGLGRRQFDDAHLVGVQRRGVLRRPLRRMGCLRRI